MKVASFREMLRNKKPPGCGGDIKISKLNI